MSVPVPKLTLYEEKDIEVLICYILRKVGQMTKEELMCCTVDYDFVLYFDFCLCFDDLKERGIVETEKLPDGDYMVKPTAKSNYLALELANSIPLTIREAAVYYAKKLTAAVKMEKAIKFEIIPLPKGYHFHVRFINELGGDDFMELKLFAPTLNAAEEMERKFINNPIGTYRSVINTFIDGYLTASQQEIQKAMEEA